RIDVQSTQLQKCTDQANDKKREKKIRPQTVLIQSRGSVPLERRGHAYQQKQYQPSGQQRFGQSKAFYRSNSRFESGDSATNADLPDKRGVNKYSGKNEQRTEKIPERAAEATS